MHIDQIPGLGQTAYVTTAHGAYKGTVTKISPTGQLTVTPEGCTHGNRFNVRYGVGKQIGGNGYLIDEETYNIRIAARADRIARVTLRRTLDAFDTRAPKQALLRQLREMIAHVETQIPGDDA